MANVTNNKLHTKIPTTGYSLMMKLKITLTETNNNQGTI